VVKKVSRFEVIKNRIKACQWDSIYLSN